MEEGTMSRGTEGSMDRNICTLEVTEESPKKGRPHEGIQSISFDVRDPVEIRLDTARVTYFDELANEQGLRLNMVLLKEKSAGVVDRWLGIRGRLGDGSPSTGIVDGGLQRLVPDGMKALPLQSFPLQLSRVPLSPHTLYLSLYGLCFLLLQGLQLLFQLVDPGGGPASLFVGGQEPPIGLQHYLFEVEKLQKGRGYDKSQVGGNHTERHTLSPREEKEEISSSWSGNLLDIKDPPVWGVGGCKSRG
ncbi:hypothetical protein LIER_19807 [Lithospermum erythrorhizon]|uniref:Uncharacterized protein n=1 Tax=Lithospermum erythrorhizon TaxID=34254 RepID=A0AAV3QJ09_LITER